VIKGKVEPEVLNTPLLMLTEIGPPTPMPPVTTIGGGVVLDSAPPKHRAGDPATLIADSTKARSMLGWAPHRGIADMIASAAAWHRTQLYVDTIIDKARAAIV